MTHQKERKINKKIIVAILLIIVLIFAIVVNIRKNTQYVELTQLKDNSTIQMMGYFIKTSNGKVIVVDGGTINDAENLKKHINENGGKVDYWFLTHFHTDHTGALSEIITKSDIEIKNIVYHACTKEMVEQYDPTRVSQYDLISNALQNERVKDKIIDPIQGQIFEFDSNIKIKILSVFENDITQNFGNNTSTVFKLNVNDKSVLFLGDTGIESSEKLLKYHKDELKSDYVQMAHHGQSGATFELYQAVNPTYCLWPTPAWLWDNDAGNGYNTGPWKTVETREWMKSLNVKENYIEKDGDITLKIN